MLDPPEPFSTGMEPYMEPAMASARQPFVPSAPAGPWGGSERQWHVVPLWCPMRNGCNINVLTLSWGKSACYLTIIQIYSIVSNILLYHWIYTRFLRAFSSTWTCCSRIGGCSRAVQDHFAVSPLRMQHFHFSSECLCVCRLILCQNVSHGRGGMLTQTAESNLLQ